MLVPTYTPTKAEGRDVSMDRVYMGGINVFLQEQVPLFRHVPHIVHRWLDSNALLRLAARAGRECRCSPAEAARGLDAARRRRAAARGRARADPLSWPTTHGRPLVAIAPALANRGGSLPGMTLIALLASIGAAGVVVSLLGAAVLRAPLVPALRSG
jgi:hypothetical protein